LNDKLEQLIALFEKEYGCKPIIYLGSFCCWKVIPTVYDCPIWLRFLKVYHIIPNTTIKQAAIVDNLDRNYCKDIDAIVLKK
jgi:GH25 family lysozyme M1 (1,4-beta-N-acetylmuramidase)